MRSARSLSLPVRLLLTGQSVFYGSCLSQFFNTNDPDHVHLLFEEDLS